MKTTELSPTHALAIVGELIGEAGRAGILIALLDGRARTAGELALVANVSAQSASAHLSKLVDGGLLAVQPQGRHRYYSLAGADVAHAIETIGSIATRGPAVAVKPGGASRRPTAASDMRRARTCYDHLAGLLAVELAIKLENSNVIRVSREREYELGPAGGRWFRAMGVDVAAVQCGKRAFARRCVDWTERRPHLAGALGAAMLARMVELRWVVRRKDSRVVRVTELGERELGRRIGNGRRAP
ncbi:MAG TPA: winged helix-turn-helix domain-containing protein [Candidatus Acidoferrum sp.]